MTVRRKVCLRRLSTRHHAEDEGLFPLRSEMVRGHMTDFPPEIGRPIVILAKPLTEGALFRFVRTSPVRQLAFSGRVVYHIQTDYSTYQLIDLMEDEQPESLLGIKQS